MGQYINYNSKGKHIGSSFEQKLESLLFEGGVCIDPPTEWEEGLVIVVDNGFFAAAGYVFDEDDMNEFITHLDGRPFQWIKLINARELVNI